MSDQKFKAHKLYPTLSWVPANVLVSYGPLSDDVKAALEAAGVDLKSGRMVRVCDGCGVLCKCGRPDPDENVP